MIRFRLRVASEHQFAPVGGWEMHVEELRGSELFEHYSRGVRPGARCLCSCFKVTRRRYTMTMKATKLCASMHSSAVPCARLYVVECGAELARRESQLLWAGDFNSFRVWFCSRRFPVPRGTRPVVQRQHLAPALLPNPRPYFVSLKASRGMLLMDRFCRRGLEVAPLLSPDRLALLGERALGYPGALTVEPEDRTDRLTM